MTMNLFGRLSIVAVAVLLASCAPREGARLELFVDSVDERVIWQTQSVLYRRLVDSVGGPLADVRTAYFPEMRKLVFEITAGAPRPEALRYLYETRGEYRVFASDGDGGVVDWITNGDIAAAEGGRSFRTAMVFVSLGPEATQRVGEISGENIGTRIEASLDGDFLHASTVTWPMGRFYDFEVENVERAELLGIVLTHGALPVDVIDYADSMAALESDVEDAQGGAAAASAGASE